MLTCSKRTQLSMALGVGLTLLAGCGSDSDSPAVTEPQPPLLTGVFLDSAVAGLNYQTATQQGITNAAGEFQYQKGEQVQFSLGATHWPTVAAAAVMTPLTLFATEDPNQQQVVNTLRLLQSLDSDGNPDNGIAITAEVAQQLEQVVLDASNAEFEQQMASVMTAAGLDPAQMVSEEQAKSHFDDTLNPRYQPADLLGRWFSAEILMPRYGENAPTLFGYRAAHWQFAQQLLIDEFEFSGKTYPQEQYNFSFNGDGMLQVEDDPYLAQLDSSKQLLLWLATNDQQQRLAASLKQAPQYQLSDLQGNWLVGSVYLPVEGSGDPAAFDVDIYDLRIDGAGQASVSNWLVAEDAEQFAMTLADDGQVQIAGDQGMAFMQLSANKDLLLQIASWDGEENEFMLALKQPQTIELALMAGRWYSITIDTPANANDEQRYNHDVDFVEIDAAGLSHWHHQQSDDPEADLTVVDSMQLSLNEQKLRDDQGGYWLVDANYNVAINLYPDVDGTHSYAVLVRVIE